MRVGVSETAAGDMSRAPSLKRWHRVAGSGIGKKGACHAFRHAMATSMLPDDAAELLTSLAAEAEEERAVANEPNET